MPKLYVRIKGGNILRRDEHTPSPTPTRSGFLTVRFVEGNDPNQAAMSAVQSVMSKLYNEGVVLNATDDPPSVEVEEIAEIAEFPATVREELGLIWFPEVEA